jgi:outer membrane receptor for ferrienterochelin and colicins
MKVFFTVLLWFVSTLSLAQSDSTKLDSSINDIKSDTLELAIESSKADSLHNSVQTGALEMIVTSEGKPVEFASINLTNSKFSGVADDKGYFKFSGIPVGDYQLVISAVGHGKLKVQARVVADSVSKIVAIYRSGSNSLNEVVVTGTMKEVGRMESTVPVEVYSSAFFRKNPTACVFESLQNINGVRPQLNCNICNTGDIHINGLEGPYTMIMIDGMPIVSGLSSVYGLSGIPNALIERIEIVKGPASSLYGSEAVGGLINLITKNPANAPVFSADVFTTSWGEVNNDIGFKFNAFKKATVLTGLNYFKYGNPIDNNKDNFTDVTLQDRISLFQKWNFERKEKRIFSLAGRYNYEDRWGGDVTWNKSFRGGNQRYAESIYTKRWELIGNYQLPVKEKLLLAMSFNNHDQNSVYGNTPYLARQTIGFSQLTWDKELSNHSLLVGTALRYTFYDDNTPGTATQTLENRPDKVWLPGIFIQDEISIMEKHKVLLGMRYDYNSVHGNIFTPRVGYKWSVNENNILRFNAGTGFRVVSLFTEEHAALTGGREVVVTGKLQPEKSYNANINYLKKIYLPNENFIGFDGSIWYTRFQNQIIPDYETDVTKIIYSNLEGHAISRGVSANMDFNFSNGLKMLVGGSYLDVYSKKTNQPNMNSKNRPFLTERWTGTWSVSYKIKKLNLGVDYTGNIYGPMRLPTLGEGDTRRETSPVWSLQNIQLTYSGNKRYEIYGGVKNLLNWTPARNQPFLISRTNDPFGNPDPSNPKDLPFDPSYVYAPNQGIRGFLGLRVNVK